MTTYKANFLPWPIRLLETTTVKVKLVNNAPGIIGNPATTSGVYTNSNFWSNLVDMRIWGSDGLETEGLNGIQNWGRMWYYGATNDTREILSLNSPLNDGTNWSYYFNSLSFSDPQDPASAWWGKTQDSSYGAPFIREKTWTPTRIRLTWEPANIPIQVYAWDDYFTDLVDYDTVRTGGSAELDITWTVPAQYHLGYLDYMGVDSAEYVSGTTGPHKPFKLLTFEAFGDDPANYWRVV